MSYGEYFAQTGDFNNCFNDKTRRKDMIYVPSDCERKGFEDKKTGRWFVYDCKWANGTHKEPELQNKDWDLLHNKYVLVSKEFSFLNSSKSKELTKAIGARDVIL